MKADTLRPGEDVGDWKLAERKLRGSMKELEDIKYALDYSAIVAMTDTSGVITYVNDKFCEVSQYSRAELLGQDHRLINSGHHPKSFMRDLWRMIARGEIWRGEIQNRAKDGSIYWVDTTIVPFLDAKRKPYQYMAIRYDITERKRAEELLREQAALARLGQMAAIIAHEVKNPIAGIRGALQVMQGSMPADGRDKMITGDIIARLDALNELVQDLLTFARPRTPKLAPVSLRSLVERTAELLKKDPGLAAVEVQLDGDDAVARVDAGQLQHVFQNVLLNAGQAMAGEGQIQVTVRKVENGRCEVVFTDSGPGMSRDVRARIFEPFYTTKHRGTGLGMAIAKQVVDLHHGELSVDTPAEGGTTVRVSLAAE